MTQTPPPLPPYPYGEPQYPYDPYASQYVAYGPYAGPPRPPLAYDPPRRAHRALVGATAVAVAAGVALGGFAIGRDTSSSTTAGSGTTVQTPSGNGNVGLFPGSTGSGSAGSGSTGSGSTGPGTGGTSTIGGSGGTGSTSASVATATQQKGIVTIVSVLSYQNAESAGTGMILSSDGEILTNNHVIDGATSITVTVESTGKSYRAKVVGTSPTNDVAVLQLSNASGLTTAKVGNASDVKDLTVGDAVKGVGNAGGTGTLTVASGAVTALDKSITASDESGQNRENLSGLIETDAPIVAGDSGGPLYDADGDIVGINTAGASSNGAQPTSTAYAIPITNALKLADQIEAGIETTTVHIGLPAFIGVSIDPQVTGGAAVTAVLNGGPAAAAGITAGSTITAVGGKAVNSPASLSTRLHAYTPGEKVGVTWTDPSGASRTATLVLATGPAD